MEKKTSIGKINGTEIFAGNSDSGETFVPIKPICTAIGIDEEGQRRKISEDEDLNSVTDLRSATGPDGKQYKMLCLPLKYIYGWLFTVNPKNVSPEARESVRKYRLECYDALYRHFSSSSSRQAESNRAEIEELEKLRQLLSEEKQIKTQISETKSRIDKIRSSRLDDGPTLFD